MTVQVPKFQSHTWRQECQIADGPNLPKKPVAGYEFNKGRRSFSDKVEKNKSYD